MADFRETISSNRTFIMGCAMISILIFHQWFIEGGALAKLRDPVDALEMIVGREYWPMPDYGELIFR